jgi:hypothetical protein
VTVKNEASYHVIVTLYVSTAVNVEHDSQGLHQGFTGTFKTGAWRPSGLKGVMQFEGDPNRLIKIEFTYMYGHDSAFVAVCFRNRHGKSAGNAEKRKTRSRTTITDSASSENIYSKPCQNLASFC